MSYYRFEQLNVWQLARAFVTVIHAISRAFPTEERFVLTSQIRRAALSIMLNIAEGSSRGSDKEFIRFLRISYTSLLEVVSCCYVALDQSYMSQKRFDFIYEKSHLIAKKINALIASLKEE